MTARVVATLAILCLASACPHPSPPPPPTVASVAILPPGNQTADALLVAGGSLLEKYAFRSPRLTVPDILAVETRELLRERGVPLVAPEAVERAVATQPDGHSAGAIAALAHAGIDGAALRLDVWRWEPDSETHPTSVLVGLEATLVDVADGRTIWRWRPPLHPIATPGAVTVGVAHEIAARAAVSELFASWAPRAPR